MFRARLNARGFVQIDCKHYYSDIIYSPVTNAASIHIVVALSVLFRWTNKPVDVKVCSCVAT